MAHEKPARRLIEKRGRRSTRRWAGFSCAILYLCKSKGYNARQVWSV